MTGCVLSSFQAGQIVVHACKTHRCTFTNHDGAGCPSGAAQHRALLTRAAREHGYQEAGA